MKVFFAFPRPVPSLGAIGRHRLVLLAICWRDLKSLAWEVPKKLGGARIDHFFEATTTVVHAFDELS